MSYSRHFNRRSFTVLSMFIINLVNLGISWRTNKPIHQVKFHTDSDISRPLPVSVYRVSSICSKKFLLTGDRGTNKNFEKCKFPLCSKNYYTQVYNFEKLTIHPIKINNHLQSVSLKTFYVCIII